MPYRGPSAVGNVRKHQRCRAIGHERAVGALQRPSNEGVLFTLVAAEIKPQILAHLRIGIVDPVLVILGGDGGQCIRAVAILLEIGLSDLAEDTGEARWRIALFRQIGGL